MPGYWGRCNHKIAFNPFFVLVRHSDLLHAISSFNQELPMNTKDHPKPVAAGIFISQQHKATKQDAAAA
jgi:hypothetical protein